MCALTNWMDLFGRKLNALYEFPLNFWFFWITLHHPMGRAFKLAKGV